MRKALLVVAALASGLFAVPPPPAQAARGMEVALQDDLLFLHRGGARGQYFSRDTAFDKMRELQGSYLRVNLIWAQALADGQMNQTEKPANVAYDWAAYDSLVNLAKGYGVKIQFALTGPAPAWATPTRSVSTGYVRPNPRHFGEFARAAAKHFGKRVKRYSIWNEPNWITWLSPVKKAPLIYRELYRKGYKNIKAVSPKAQVLLGELAPYKRGSLSMAPLKFVRKMTCVNGRYKRARRGRCRGGKLKADGFAHHPYDFDNPPNKARKGRDNVTIGALHRLTRALDKLKRSRALVPRKGKHMPLYLTEFGYFREGERKISERKRRRWTKRGFEIARKHPRVKQVVYYVFVRPPGGTFFDLSLLDHTGAETGTYEALVKWARKKAKKRQIKRPGRKRAGVNDANPPPPPGPPPAPPPPPPDGGGEPPPPEEPPCLLDVPDGVPCVVPPRLVASSR